MLTILFAGCNSAEAKRVNLKFRHKRLAGLMGAHEKEVAQKAKMTAAAPTPGETGLKKSPTAQTASAAKEKMSNLAKASKVSNLLPRRSRRSIAAPIAVPNVKKAAAATVTTVKKNNVNVRSMKAPVPFPKAAAPTAATTASPAKPPPSVMSVMHAIEMMKSK